VARTVGFGQKKLSAVARSGLNCGTEPSDESRHPHLVAPDFPKGILSLGALGKPVCSIPQIGKHRDDLLHLAHLRYFNCALDQRAFLPNLLLQMDIAAAAMMQPSIPVTTA
jgi:hypothetical protein